jgi:biotin-(acetyl-CoA carboxylase) ligase
MNWARAQAVHRISDKEKIQENVIRELRAITESVFQEAFQQWKKRWEQCIASRGDYFEEDSV